MFVVRNNGPKVLVKTGKLDISVDSDMAFTTEDLEVANAFRALPSFTVSERPAQKDEVPKIGAKKKDADDGVPPATKANG